MSNHPKNLFEFEELRKLFKYEQGYSTCLISKECDVRLWTNELCGLSEHVLENHPEVFDAMQSLQTKAVNRLRIARVFKRKLDEIESSEEPSKLRGFKRKQDEPESSQLPSKRQRFSPVASTKSQKGPSSSKPEINEGTEDRRLRPVDIDKIQEIVKSEHFHKLMAQFCYLDNCKCDCIFGRSAKVHLRHQVAEKRAELAALEAKLLEAES